MKVLLFLFSIIFSRTNAEDLTCPNGQIQFDPPQVKPIAVTYPKSFTGFLPPVFPNKFTCNYKINVPRGWFAKIHLSVNPINPGYGAAPVIVTDQLGKSEEVASADHQPFYFLANGGTFRLTTGMAERRFGFIVYWEKYPTTFNPYSINVNMSDTEPQIIKVNYTSPFLITAEKKVSVVIVPPRWDVNFYRLRGIMIFDGPDWNSTCLGTAYQLWHSFAQWVSTGNQLTVQLLPGFYTTEDVRFIFQDYENTKHIVHYKGVSCTDRDKYCSVRLDSSNGPSAIVTYIENDVSETVTNLYGNGTLDVYIGGVTSSKSNLIASYQVGESDSSLPQIFRGNTRTYVLNGNNSRATILFARDRKYIISDSNSIGRKGFISSSHYMESYTDQYAGAEINAPKDTLAMFSFIIQCVDITQNTTFNVMVMNSKTVAYNKQYNSSNLPVLNQAVNAIGDKLTVLFDSKKDFSKGLYMDFELLKASSDFYSIVLIFAMSLIVYLS